MKRFTSSQQIGEWEHSFIKLVEHYREHNHNIRVDWNVLRKQLEFCADHGFLAVEGTPDNMTGYLAGHIVFDMFNGDIVGAQVGFYAKTPWACLRLLDAFVTSCRKRGCEHVRLHTNFVQPKWRKILEKRGFVPTDICYAKKL